MEYSHQQWILRVVAQLMDGQFSLRNLRQQSSGILRQHPVFEDM